MIVSNGGSKLSSSIYIGNNETIVKSKIGSSFIRILFATALKVNRYFNQVRGFWLEKSVKMLLVEEFQL